MSLKKYNQSLSHPKSASLLRAALSVVKHIQEAGYEAYFVGGCVRDLLEGKPPYDIDITTSATPEDIETLFDTVIPIGRKFGIVIVRYGEFSFEIATFRAESTKSDGRRPANITFSDAKQDVLRRDFTINALLYDPIEKCVLDYVGGVQDLHNRILRFVGDPEQRIHEDFLRMLRAVRFKTTLQYRFAPGIKECIQKHAHRSTILSAERIRDELNKILKSPERMQGIDELSETGLLHFVLPEIDACKNVPQPYRYHQEGDVYIHTLECLRSLARNTPLCIIWAVLLHDCGKPASFSSEGDRIHFNGHTEKGVFLATKILKCLAFSSKDSSKITWLIAHHMHIGSIPLMKRIHQHRILTHPLFPALLKVFKADIMGSKPRDLTGYREVRMLFKQESMLLLAMPKRLLTGKDIIQLTAIKAGPRIGEMLSLIHEAHLEGKIKTREEAEKLVEQLLHHNLV